MASKLKVTQIRSAIDRPKDQKATVRALGIHRLHQSVLRRAPDATGYSSLDMSDMAHPGTAQPHLRGVRRSCPLLHLLLGVYL